MIAWVLEILHSIFSSWAIAAITICGAWLFFMVNPAMAERGLVKDHKLAKWGGLLYLVGGPGIYLLLKIAAFFVNT